MPSFLQVVDTGTCTFRPLPFAAPIFGGLVLSAGDVHEVSWMAEFILGVSSFVLAHVRWRPGRGDELYRHLKTKNFSCAFESCLAMVVSL